MMNLIAKGLGRLGYYLVPKEQLPVDASEDEKRIIRAVKPYTATSFERILALIHATKYVVQNGLEGDFVECGVWRGGSVMTVSMTLQSLGETNRRLFLYDTFSGMTPPTTKDRQYDGHAARALLQATPENTGVWCYADMQDVRRNVNSTGSRPTKFITFKEKLKTPSRTRYLVKSACCVWTRNGTNQLSMS